MLDIRPLEEVLIPSLVELAKTTFVQSHGHSASDSDISAYIESKLNEDEFKREFVNPSNLFHLLYHDNELVGYSKVCFDSPYKVIELQAVTKLERIYVLKEFIGRGMGLKLLNFNMELSKSRLQKGMWLYVWIENIRGINFYQRAGFEIISHEEFKISNTHSNPNHIMYLKY